MAIAVTCECGQHFKVKEEFAGKRGKCPACGHVLLIPKPDDVLAVQEEPAVEADVSPKPSPRPSPKPAAVPTTVSRKALERYGDLLTRESGTSLRDYTYWLLLLTFIPLGFSLLSKHDEDVIDRLERTLSQVSPQEKARVERMMESDGVDEDVLFTLMPNGRLEGAHLARKTWLHWLYGGLAGVGYLVLILLVFRLGGAEPLQLLFIGSFTGTIGIVLLFVFQFIADATQGHLIVSRNIFIMILFWGAWAIGFSYRAALDPDTNLFLSLIGFTFGVGLCEEVAKALPLIWHFRRKGELDWRGACVWGLASGAGFGVAEGIIYAADFYNGIATGGIYIVRFVSCVALHAIWTASVGLFIWKYHHFLEGEFAWHDWIPRAVLLVSVPMLLHGAYDTFLKKDMNGLALATALVSFAWFAWLLESARGAEGVAPTKTKLRHV